MVAPEGHLLPHQAWPHPDHQETTTLKEEEGEAPTRRRGLERPAAVLPLFERVGIGMWGCGSGKRWARNL